MRPYDPPLVRELGTIEDVTLNGGYDSDSLQKRWGRQGDFWNWYRPQDVGVSALSV
jgi:hypothetical protein